MTDFDKKLDDAIGSVLHNVVTKDSDRYDTEDHKYFIGEIKKIMRELIEKAEPHNRHYVSTQSVDLNIGAHESINIDKEWEQLGKIEGFIKGISDYKQNLLKELE